MQETGAIRQPPGLRLHHLKTLALVISLVGGLTTAMLIGRFFDFDSAWVWRIGYPGIFMVGVVGAVAIVLPIPMLPLVFAGSSFLDPYVVALIAAAGMTVGMALSYLIGPLGHRKMARVLHDGDHWYARWMRHTRAHYERRPIISSFLLAAFPNPVYAYTGILTGSMGVSMHRFCLGTFLGKTAQAMTVALAGFYVGSLPFLS